jgi:hypothetical protein
MPSHIIYFITLIEEYVTMNDGNLMQSRAETTLGRYVLQNKIGSGAALVLIGGLGTWEIASHLGQTGSKSPHHLPTPTTRRTTASAPGPNGPTLTLTGHTKPVIALTWPPARSILLKSTW